MFSASMCPQFRQAFISDPSLQTKSDRKIVIQKLTDRPVVVIGNPRSRVGSKEMGASRVLGQAGLVLAWGGDQGDGWGGPGARGWTPILDYGPGAWGRTQIYMFAQYKSHLYELVLYYYHRMASKSKNPASIFGSPQAVLHSSTNDQNKTKSCQHLEQSASGPKPLY